MPVLLPVFLVLILLFMAPLLFFVGPLLLGSVGLADDSLMRDRGVPTLAT